MLVFIVDKRRIKEFKGAELVFIFDSENLFNKLSKEFRCVNLDKRGFIINENFFPKSSIKSKHIYFDVKRGVYGYFKKKYHQVLSKEIVMLRGYKDSIYNLVVNQSKKLEKRKQYEEASKLLDMEILRNIEEILKFENISLNRYSQYLNNYIYSFYRAYIYSFANKRGIDFLSDIFRFNLFIDIMRFYRYESKDLLKMGFKNSYLKVISRLFIEQIHKNNFKSFIKRNIEYYKNLEIY